MTRRRLLPVLLALATVAGACGQPPSTPIGMKEYPADIVYADQAKPPPPTMPAAANPVPAFPGFIAPPAPRPTLQPVHSTTTLAPLTTTTTVPPVACPEDDPLAVPAEAGNSIPGTPLPGGYPFRQQGIVQLQGEDDVVLDGEVVHRVDEIVPMPEGSVRYNVAVEQGDSATVTTYEVTRRSVQNRPVDNGLHIVQIRRSDELGTDAFTPSAPIKVLPVPVFRGAQFSSAGSDPLHRTSMAIHGTVVGKTRVNACGTPVDAWLVEVGPEPQTGQPSRIVGPDREVTITGTYAVATHLGGLIVAEDLTFEGSEGTRRLEMHRTTAINRTEPDR